jgi:TetR/AcrR family transcriptional repressor of nem operon
MVETRRQNWQARKKQSHGRILAAAGRRLRTAGIDGLSVAEVMADASLTHGGFYAHFDSKGDMVAEGFAYAASEAREMWFERLDDVRGGESLKWLAGRYLRPRHRDHPEDGCPFAALAMDISRGDPALREVFDAALKDTVTQVAAKLDDLPAEEARSQAIIFMSLCVGALNLARAVSDAEFSEDILRTVRQVASALPDNTRKKEG